MTPVHSGHLPRPLKRLPRQVCLEWTDEPLTYQISISQNLGAGLIWIPLEQKWLHVQSECFKVDTDFLLIDLRMEDSG